MGFELRRQRRGAEGDAVDPAGEIVQEPERAHIRTVLAIDQLPLGVISTACSGKLVVTANALASRRCQ